MDIDIIIEVDEFPPYDGKPFDPYDERISVSEDTYNKVKEYHEKGIDILNEMNIPELIPILNDIRTDIIEEAEDRFYNSEEEEFKEPKITIRVDDINKTIPEYVTKLRNLIQELRSEGCPESYIEEFDGEELGDVLDRMDGVKGKWEEKITFKLEDLLHASEDDAWTYKPDLKNL